MNPAKLPQLFAGFSEHAQQVPVEAELINSPWKRIGTEQYLMRRRRNAECPGRPRRPRSAGPGDLAPDGRPSLRVDRHVDDDLSKIFTLPVEYLDAAIAAIRDIEISSRIDSDA